MNSKKITPKKNKAQAMVEFAIALPILLMLLYGILEVGRLLFTYSSVVNATRQAVRWGSTTGVGSDGSTPRYQDCAGIRAAAQRGDYLDVFDDGDIEIWYDSGPNTGAYPGIGTCPIGNLTNNDSRINVSIDYDFKAIIPKLVPFVSRTINATSARTIITSISISGQANVGVTPFTSTPSPTFTPTFTPSRTPTRTPTNTPGPSPTYTRTRTPGATATDVTASLCYVNFTVNNWGGGGFGANIIITNNSTAPISGYTLSWNFTAGQQVTSGWNATYSQTGASVSASNPSTNWNGTIGANGGTVTFGFNGSYPGSDNPIPTSFTLNGEPCSPANLASATPSPTLTPTATYTHTPSFTPTASSTPISNCNLVTHGPITITTLDAYMSMTINNPTGVPLRIQDITVFWNHDTGHRTGTDKTLRLNNGTLGGTFFTGNTYAPSFTIIPFNLTVPTGSSLIRFQFHQVYDRLDGTERILINLATNGCNNYPIDSAN